MNNDVYFQNVLIKLPYSKSALMEVLFLVFLLRLLHSDVQKIELVSTSDTDSLFLKAFLGLSSAGDTKDESSRIFSRALLNVLKMEAVRSSWSLACLKARSHWYSPRLASTSLASVYSLP
jgi:hypothetical protein